MTIKLLVELIVSVIACVALGELGAFFTIPKIGTWYSELKKPRFTPPNSIFPPIWIVLYVLMGIAVFFLWKEGLDQGNVRLAFWMFWGQFALNILWSAVFFGRKSLSGGLAVILLLWSAILVTIITSFRVSALAGVLLIPYIIWVTIAANLNFQVWKLNR
jgi:translocator protein